MNLMDYKAMGQRIRRRRQELDLRQGELAERISVSTSFLGHVERGTRKPSLETCKKISQALGLSMDVMVRAHEINLEECEDRELDLLRARQVLELTLELMGTREPSI